MSTLLPGNGSTSGSMGIGTAPTAVTTTTTTKIPVALDTPERSTSRSTPTAVRHGSRKKADLEEGRGLGGTPRLVSRSSTRQRRIRQIPRNQPREASSEEDPLEILPFISPLKFNQKKGLKIDGIEPNTPGLLKPTQQRSPRKQSPKKPSPDKSDKSIPQSSGWSVNVLISDTDTTLAAVADSPDIRSPPPRLTILRRNNVNDKLSTSTDEDAAHIGSLNAFDSYDQEFPDLSGQVLTEQSASEINARSSGLASIVGPYKSLLPSLTVTSKTTPTRLGEKTGGGIVRLGAFYGTALNGRDLDERIRQNVPRTIETGHVQEWDSSTSDNDSEGRVGSPRISSADKVNSVIENRDVSGTTGSRRTDLYADNESENAGAGLQTPASSRSISQKSDEEIRGEGVETQTVGENTSVEDGPASMPTQYCDKPDDTSERVNEMQARPWTTEDWKRLALLHPRRMDPLPSWLVKPRAELRAAFPEFSDRELARRILALDSGRYARECGDK
ncbi:uncharacterized protein V1516DRAFT_663501 [Lipomyces oligophaga]|uniref:uncharacterized protein n=1 Tax=Lipomyces oligophaga TaxID=45792 RepID=UPI0034CE3B0D